ncbi:MAG: isoamylase early set domain-containing protein [Chloroflexota bacterium]
MFIKKLKKSGKYTVTFRIPCEELPEDVVASQINIVASFNNWSITETPMKIADSIGWEAKVKLKPGQYEFRYLINDSYWYNDWAADGYEPNRLQNADNCLLILDKPKKEKKGKGKSSKKEGKEKEKAAPKAEKKSEKATSKPASKAKPKTE